MPIVEWSARSPILVNIHPSVDSLAYLEKLYDLWYNGEISLLKSVSGSPSLLIVEAAKTGTFYINTWSKGQTLAFDLIPPLHIAQGADLKAIRQDGQEVDPWNHHGFYLLGPDGNKLNVLLDCLPRF